VMVPFAGEGVNVAMEDSMKLARAIIDAAETGTKEALFAKVKAFEEDMFKRAALIQRESYENMQDFFFTPGAPGTTIERFFIRAISSHIGNVGAMLAAPLIYAYFFFIKWWYIK